ncbi:DNA binding domain protein, excisionase family [delta proteobacterium NaphS2]|nr:DNA binding domain protein, excisionase family [delta proteobacterium NaphS2]
MAERAQHIDKGKIFDNMSANNTQRSKILTAQEVAEILRVHPSTVSRYAMSGELKSYVIGSRRLFKEDDIWAFFDNQADRRHAARKEI